MSFFTKKTEFGKELRVGRLIAVIGIIFLLLVLILSCFTSVPAGYTGVPVTFGKVADYTFDSGSITSLLFFVFGCVARL